MFSLLKLTSRVLVFFFLFERLQTTSVWEEEVRGTVPAATQGGLGVALFS